MTQPDGFMPTDAANYSSLSDFASKTQSDWEDSLVGDETDRWTDLLTGLFGDMPGGSSFITTLLTQLWTSLTGQSGDTFASATAALTALGTWATDLWSQLQASGTAFWTFLTSCSAAITGFTTWSQLITDLDAAWTTYLTSVSAINESEMASFSDMLSKLFPSINVSTGENTQWAALMAQITALQTLLASPPVSAADWSTWWTATLEALGVDSTDATNTANFLSGNYASALNANAWVTRLLTDVTIFIDLMHSHYPAGSPEDGPTTTSGGVRTWYSAIADVLSLFNIVTSVTAPTGIVADVGSLAVDTQTRVITNEDTLATVQAQVQALTTDDPSVAGVKITGAASGTGNQWGPDWTVNGTSGYTIKNDIGSFAWDTQVSTANDKIADGYYNVKDALTDDVIVSAVFLDGTKVDGSGAAGPWNTLKARRNAAGTEYIWVRAIRNQVTLGYCVAGTESIWATYAINVPAGALLELQCGTAADHRIYQVRVNGVNQAPYTEVGTSSVLGASNRKGGQDQKATKGIFGDQWPPSRIRQWGMKDTNVSASTYGTSARFYRNTTTSTSGLPKGSASGLATTVFNATEYCSPDIELLAGGLAFYTPGRYLVNFAVRFDAALTTGCAAGIIRNTGSAAIYAEGVNYSAASVIGLSGSFEVNAIGDGTATEAWYPCADLAGSGTGPGIKGDGAGITTWLSVTRIG